MVIKTDKEGKEAVHALCDIALKSNGLQILEVIIQILNSVKDLEQLTEDSK